MKQQHNTVIHCNEKNTKKTKKPKEKIDFLFNPKPHGSGPICPHFFQRPIIQKVLKCKKSAKNTYSTENVC
jgi:hypothetical protein